jgi:hypothetical protein
MVGMALSCPPNGLQLATAVTLKLDSKKNQNGFGAILYQTPSLIRPDDYRIVLTSGLKAIHPWLNLWQSILGSYLWQLILGSMYLK